MIELEELLREFEGLAPPELERWIGNAWIRPDGTPGRYRFHEIDVARVRLIIELKETMEVSEAALPTVLSLLDQLYEMRRRMHRLNQALAVNVPRDVAQRLLAAMSAG